MDAGPTAAACESAPAAARGGLSSLLVSGVTLALDAGGLDVGWAKELAQLASLVPPSPGAGPADAVRQTGGADGRGCKGRDDCGGVAKGGNDGPPSLSRPSPGGHGRFVLTVMDLALRAEPAPAPAPIVPVRGGGRVAAALLIEGARWAADAASGAAQRVQLHSLSFHVAAAAKRGGCAGGWGPSAPRDLPSMSLQVRGRQAVGGGGVRGGSMHAQRRPSLHGLGQVWAL